MKRLWSVTRQNRCHGLSLPAAEFTRERYCACVTYLLAKLVNVAHLMWAQITKRAYFTKA